MVAVNAIRRVEIVGTSTGLDETRSKLEAVARAQTTVAQTAAGMAVTTEQSARRQLSSASNYDRLRRSIDETYRTEQRYSQGQSIIERAFQQGHIQATEYARSLQLLADKHGVVSLAAARQAAELQRAAEVQARINSLTGVSGGSDSAARAADVEAYGQALSRLQAKYDPVFAASERYRAALLDIDQAQRAGAISAEVATAARLKAIGSYNGEISALERVATARKAAAQAMVDGQTIAPDRGADIAAYGKQLDDLRAKYNPLYAAGRQYKDTLADINMAAKVGALSEAERAAAIQQTKTAFVQQVGSIKNATSATGDMTKQAGLARHELVNLSRQAQDVGTMLAMGASPMQVFTSQAAQIFDIFSSSRGTVTGFFSQVASGAAAFATSSIGAFTAVGAVVVGGVAALVSYRNEQEKIQLSLMGVGRASGVTAQQLNEVGKAASSWSGLSTSEATEFATALAATGRVAQENLLPATQNAKNLAKVLGTDLAGAAQAMGQALSGNLDPINARLGAFSVAMKEQITLLMAQGREAQAQVLINKQVADATKAASEATGGWSKAWTVLGNAASEAWRAIGRGADQLTGNTSLEDQYRGAVSELEKLIKKRDEVQKQDRSWMTDEQRSRINSVFRLPSGAAADDVNRKNLEVLNDLIAKGETNTKKLKDAMDAVKTSSDAVKANMQSVADQALRATLSPEIGARQALAVQTASATALARDPQRQAALGMTQAQADEQVKRAKGVEEGYRTSAQRIAESFELANRAVTAFSPKQRAELAQLETAARLRDDPSMSPEDKRVAAQEAYNAALRQGNVALSEAARARALSAQQAVDTAQKEISMVGQTVGKQAEMRANLQAYQALEQQAAQNRTAFDNAEYARLQKKNEELGRTVQLLAKTQINDQISFDRATIGLSQDDVQIAQQLRSIYPDVATALGSTEAAGMRLNNQLREARDISTGFANDLVSGLLRGDDAMKALAASAASLVSKLASANTTRFMQGGSFFGSQSLMSGAGALGMAGAGMAGYQSGNWATGALGGAMAGATFGPIGAAVGGIAGLIGGIFGNSRKKAEEEAKAIQAAQERAAAYSMRATIAGLDQNTREGSIAALEAKLSAERVQEATNGNQALAMLLVAQHAERLALQKQWDQQEIAAAKAKQEAIDARVLSAQDRLFQAMNDTSTLEGQLAAADRQFLRERLDEMKAGGQALNDLVAAQEAERIAIIKRYNEDLLKFVQGVASTVRAYLEGLKTGPSSILSPQQQLAAAQSNFQAQLAKANAGDRDALSGITQVAQTLLDQAKSFYASSSGYTDIYNQVTAALQGVANIGAGTVSDNDKVIAAINESKVATTGTITTTSLQEQSLLGAMNSVLGAINSLNDRLVAAINQLGAVTSSIGSDHSGWLSAIWVATSKSASNSGGTFWNWLGFKNGGVIPGYAGGGVVGNGIHNVDSVLARYAGGGTIALAGGEHVMPAGRTAQYLPQLEAMRRGTWAGNDNARPVDPAPYFTGLARTLIADGEATRAELRLLRAEVAGRGRDQVSAIKETPATRPGRKSAA